MLKRDPKTHTEGKYRLRLEYSYQASLGQKVEPENDHQLPGVAFVSLSSKHADFHFSWCTEVQPFSWAAVTGWKKCRGSLFSFQGRMLFTKFKENFDSRNFMSSCYFPW